MDKLDRWADLVPPAELDTYRKAGFGRRIGLGERVGLLNIDTTWCFVDPAYALCGARDEKLIASLIRITDTFRALGLPIYYSKRGDRSHPTKRGVWNHKLGTSGEFQYTGDPKADEWPEEYGPRREDRVVSKDKPSPFFDTPLASWMRYDGIDSLVVVGVATSGCVRAGVCDAFSHNFRVTVAEEACGDRSNTAARANLFDMDMKMADVEPLDTVIATLEARFGRKIAAE